MHGRVSPVNSGTDANAGGNHRKNMVQASSQPETSRHRLHRSLLAALLDQITPAEESCGLDDLVRAGKVLYVGISTRRRGLCEIQHSRGTARLDALRRLADRIQSLRAHGGARTRADDESQQMTVLAGSPLRKVVLTGKYLPRKI